MALLGTARPPSTAEEQDRELQALAERVKKRFKEMEKLHDQYVPRWDHFDGLYHNYDDLKSNYRAALENDRDAARGVVLQARRDWGGDLHIPFAFATVETVLPRVISQRPRIHGKPLEPAAVKAARPIADLINQQYADINYELKLIPTCRRAMKLGLGVQKLYWERDVRMMDRTVPDPGGGYRVVEMETVLHDGPQVEDVDVYDFFWDPAAKSMETCEDVLHRTWRSYAYVERQIKTGRWFALDLEAIKGMGKSGRFNELWQRRRESQGLSPTAETGAGDLHEVWEYHTRGKVVTILDETFVVVNSRSPFGHRDLPFQIYRPTLQEGQFVGKGEIEPIEHLIAELNTLRTQRRDNATMVLQRIYAYVEGAIAKKNLRFAPGMAIPVSQTHNPQEVLYQLPVHDIPNSGYQEEAALKTDIEMASGIADPVTGGSAGLPDTATGAQLVQQAANVRISLKARMLLIETLRPTANQTLALDRRNIQDAREVRIDDPAEAEGYRFIPIDPEILNADVELVPEEHSTEPENRVQRINDAMSLYEAFRQNPVIKPQRLAEHVLGEFGMRDIEGWFAQAEDPPADAVAEAARIAMIEAGIAEDVATERALALIDDGRVVAEQMAAEASQNGDLQPQE